MRDCCRRDVLVSSFFAIALAWAVPRPAAATTILALDVPELERCAERIFVGRVADVQLGFDEQGMPVAWTTFAIEQSLKGVTGARVTIKQLRSGQATQPGALFRVPAMPAYTRGEKVLLFLHQDSVLGFTSPVGLGQGAFRVRGNGDDALVENDVGNANVAPGLAPASAAAPRRAQRAVRTLRLSDLVAHVHAAHGAR
jgi:hypothetical protein